MAFGDSPINPIPAKSAWNPYALISTLGNRFPNTDIFPISQPYLPTDAFGFVDEFSNTLINIQAYSATVAGLAALGLTGMVAAVGMGITEALCIKYSRLGNGGALTSSQPFIDLTPSPRIGFQIGNIFKHQAYMGLDIIGLGNGQLGQPIVWYYMTGYPSIEYCTNSTFSQVYLSHGSIVGTRWDTTDPTKPTMYVKISNQSTPPPTGFSPGGKMIVWSSLKKPAVVTTGEQPAWIPQVYKVVSVNSSWEVQITLDPSSPPPATTGASPTTQYFVANGDFFALFQDGEKAQVGGMVINLKSDDPNFGKIGHLNQNNQVNFYGNLGTQPFNSGNYGAMIPWVMGDPALMHEYGLQEVNGIHSTNQQQYRLDANIQGLWLPPITPAPSTIAPSVPPPQVAKIIGLSGDMAFGLVVNGSTSKGPLTITNIGNTKLTVTGIVYPTGFSGDWTKGTIEAGGFQTVVVTFAPTSSTVAYSGMIAVNSDATSGTYTIYASGNVFNGNTAYVDPAAQSGVWLPADSGDANRRGEWNSFGGTQTQGAQLLEATKPDSVQLILSQFSDKAYQNFSAGCLAGEFLIFNGMVYPIISQSRSDSVQVQNTPMNGLVNILSNLKVASGSVTAGIFQRNYWLISEMYPGDPVSAGAAVGLWGGNPTSIMNNPGDKTLGPSTTVAWSAQPARLAKMDSTETSRWGVDSLDLRALVPVQSSVPNPILAYQTQKTSVKNKQGQLYTLINPNWILHVRDTDTNYPISWISVQMQNDDLQITVTIDSQANITKSQTVSILFNDPYPRNSSSLEGSFSVQAQFKAALGPDPLGADKQVWQIATGGWYNAGQYMFSGRIPASTPFSLVDFSFGYNPLSNYYNLGGSPAVFATTRRTNSSMTMCQHQLSGRQHIFFDDPSYDSLLVMRSADTDWKNQIEQSPICVGYPIPLSATATPPADVDIVMSPTFNIPPETTSPNFPNFSTYWLRIKNSYFQSLVTGAGGLSTPLFRQYGLTNSVRTNAGCHFPFEYYPPVKPANATAVPPVPTAVPAYMPNSTSSTDLSLVPIKSSGPLFTVLSGSDPSVETGGLEVKNVQYALTSQTIHSALSKEIIYNAKGAMFLCYGGVLPGHLAPAITAQPASGSTPAVMAQKSEQLPDAQSVFIISSEDEGQYWGSPRVRRPTSSTPSPEWGLPLVLMRNFNFAGALFDTVGDRILLFGYVYESGSISNTALSLAMYAISFATLKVSNTYPVLPTPLSAAVAYMRPPQVVAPSPTFTPSPGFIGPPAPSVGSISSWGDEMFIKIIGNSEAKAEIVTADVVQPDLIFASMHGSSLQILLQDDSARTIIGVSSQNKGETWGLNSTIYARNGASAPYLFPDGAGSLLFYFQNSTLYCKRIALKPTDAAGNDNQGQVLYDTTVPTFVTTGVAPQKITVKSTESGIITAYYVLINGSLGASTSRSGGDRWEPMVNW